MLTGVINTNETFRLVIDRPAASALMSVSSMPSITPLPSLSVWYGPFRPKNACTLVAVSVHTKTSWSRIVKPSGSSRPRIAAGSSTALAGRPVAMSTVSIPALVIVKVPVRWTNPSSSISAVNVNESVSTEELNRVSRAIRSVSLPGSNVTPPKSTEATDACRLLSLTAWSLGTLLATSPSNTRSPAPSNSSITARPESWP